MCLSDSHREILVNPFSTPELTVMLQHSSGLNAYPELQPSLLCLSRGGGQNQIKLTSWTCSTDTKDDTGFLG